MKVKSVCSVIAVGLMFIGCSKQSQEKAPVAEYGNGYVPSRVAYAWSLPLPPSIKGVTIGTPLEELDRKLGKPVTQKTDIQERNEAGLGDFKYYTYPGLEITLLRDEESKPYWVTDIILKNGWEVYPGIKIGSTRELVTKLIGQPEGSIPLNKEGAESLFYGFKGNDMSLKLMNGKVIGIEMSADLS